MKRILFVSLLLTAVAVSATVARAQDASVFTGEYADYIFTYNVLDGISVTDTILSDGSDDGTCLLKDAQVLEFADLTAIVVQAASAPASSGADVIVSSEADDSIDALDGDDTILAVGGADTIDGGAGYDVIVISAPIAGYTPGADANGNLTVAGPGLSITATNIEELQFTDSVVDASALVAAMAGAWPEGVRAATAVNTYIDPFDDPDLSDWVVDRYPPAVFATTVFDGDNRLHVGIAAADYQPPTAPGLNLNYQGRKKSLGTTDNSIGTYVTADLYIGADWSTQTRHASLWAKLTEPGGASKYPVFGFSSVGTTSSTFVSWDYDLGQWIDFGLPDGFAYDAWYTLQIRLTDSGVEFYIDGVLKSTLSNPYGSSAYFGDILLQAYNYAEDYDVYWDNVGSGVTPTADPDNIWVDFAYTGAVERGTSDQPFNMLEEGVSAVTTGKTVHIKGDTAVSTTDETLRITKAMRIEAVGGPVRLGV